MTSSLKGKYQSLKNDLPANCRLIAVSKYVGIQSIQECYELGIRDFGESRVLEALEKKKALADKKDICWHLIGHLQSNKAKEAVQIFDFIHSIDSLRLAAEVDKQAALINKKQSVLLQVKLADDESKFGFLPESLHELIPDLLELKNLQITGLMTILPKDLSKSQNLSLFSQLKTFQDKLLKTMQEKYSCKTNLAELSMGMSSDYKEAIEAGSTMLRIGSLLFRN
jgi:PLP dependent protein